MAGRVPEISQIIFQLVLGSGVFCVGKLLRIGQMMLTKLGVTTLQTAVKQKDQAAWGAAPLPPWSVLFQLEYMV